MDDVCGVPMSVGTVSQSEQATTQVLDPPGEEARAGVEAPEVAHLDATSCQVFAPRSRTFIRAARAPKRTPVKGIFPLQGLTTDNIPFLEGVRHVEVSPPPDRACEPLRPR